MTQHFIEILQKNSIALHLAMKLNRFIGDVINVEEMLVGVVKSVSLDELI